MKKRLAVTAIGIGLIICGISGYIRGSTEAECISVEYVVTDGDTLWEIAEKAYGENADIRKAVHEIRKINGCGGDIYPGDILKIPKR